MLISKGHDKMGDRKYLLGRQAKNSIEFELVASGRSGFLNSTASPLCDPAYCHTVGSNMF